MIDFSMKYPWTQLKQTPDIKTAAHIPPAMVWAFMSPRSIRWDCNDNCDGINRACEMWLGQEGRALTNEINTHIKEIPDSALASCYDQAKKRSILDFPNPRTEK